jgi:hypothetical protein
MKSSGLSRARGTHAAETYSVSKAKAFLDRLLVKSEKGTDVYIVRRGKRFLLQPMDDIEAIPMRPPGYFRFDREDIELDKKFSAANVVPGPDRE